MQDLEPFILPLFVYGEPFNGWSVTPGALRWKTENFPYEIVVLEGESMAEAEKVPVGFLEALDVVTDAEGNHTLWATGRVTPGVFAAVPGTDLVRTLMPSVRNGIWATALDGTSRNLVQGGELVGLTVAMAPARS